MTNKERLEEDSTWGLPPSPGQAGQVHPPAKVCSLLVIEDDDADYEAIRRCLGQVTTVDFQLDRAVGLAGGLECLARGGVDIVLLDLGLPDSRGMDTLRKLRSRSSQVPVVVLTGLDDESLAVEAVKGGAQDYVVKGKFGPDLLVRSLRYALARNKNRAMQSRLLELTRTSEQNLRNIITSNADGMVVVDVHGVIQYANPAAASLFDRSTRELAGTKFGYPLTPGATTEVEFVRGRSRRTPVELRLVELSWEGKPAYLAVLRDLTHQKQVEKERERMAAELARSNGELEHFASVAAHDMRESLRTVAGYLEQCQSRYGDKLDCEANEYIEIAVAGVQRMQGMLDDLLTYARVGTGQRALASVDLNAVAVEVEKNLEAAICQHQATFTWDELPTVSGDRRQVVQLLQNLVGNAIKFHGQEPPRIHFGAERTGGTWAFFVRDNGIGIDPQNHERVFQIFQRLHSPDEYPGTGIGLAICRRIVERHGGRIWLESQPGKGTTVRFTLPEAGMSG